MDDEGGSDDFYIETKFLNLLNTSGYFQPGYDYSDDLFNFNRVAGEADDPKQTRYP